MKHITFSLLLLVVTSLFSSIHAQTVTDEECNKFHTGEFVDGTLSYITITRDSLYQVETDTRTGKKSTYEIKWIDACTYELIFVKSEDKKMRKGAKKIGTLRISITYADEDGYRYIATAPGLLQPMRGSIKVKK